MGKGRWKFNDEPDVEIPPSSGGRHAGVFDLKDVVRGHGKARKGHFEAPTFCGEVGDIDADPGEGIDERYSFRGEEVRSEALKFGMIFFFNNNDDVFLTNNPSRRCMKDDVALTGKVEAVTIFGPRRYADPDPVLFLQAAIPSAPRTPRG